MLAEASAHSEEDIPFGGKRSTPTLSVIERHKIETDKRTRKYGLIITVVCIVAILIIYGVEVYLTMKNLDSPEGLSATIIDLMKTIILLALGYLFSKALSE